MRRAVWVLAVLAVLAVAGTATVAAVVPARSTQQWLRGHGLEIAVPARGWTLAPSSEAVRYDETTMVRAPAVLDSGFCPSSASSSRAFVGLLPPAAGSLPDVVATTASAWARGIAGTPAMAVRAGGDRVDLDLPVPPGPCSPATAHLTVVGRAVPGGVAVLLLVRDVGQPRDLTPAAAERILGSLRAAR